MAFPFTLEHEMIRQAARGWLSAWYAEGKGPERVYQSGVSFDADAWQGFAGEQGMAGVAIDEAYGGAGLGDLGRVVVMEELGATLCSIPFLSTCSIAADLIMAAESDAVRNNYLPKIADGKMRASFCAGHVSGTNKSASVIEPAQLDKLILSSRTDGGDIDLVLIDGAATGLKITQEKTLDPTRGVGQVDWADVAPADMIGLGRLSETEFNKVFYRALIGLAAESVGGAGKCLDMTLEYAKQRVQFGRPIASFQAVKHRCADMFVKVEAARSAVYAAAVASDDKKTELSLIAKAYATDVFFDVAGDAIQLHGGIGFTWEYPLHYFFKRARANRALFGSPQRDYGKLADKIFGDAA